MKKMIFAMVALMTLTTAYATEHKLLQVVNKSDNAKYDLYISAGEDEKAEGLLLKDLKSGETTSYNISGLDKGAVLKQEGKYKVIVIRSNDFLNDRGGHFTVDYLYSGISGKRKEFELKIEFDGRWKAFFSGEEVNSLIFHPKKVLGKLVGISKVDKQ